MSERIFEGNLFSVRKDTLQSRPLGTIIREVVEHPGAVAIVPLLNQNEVIMVEQYRHAVRESLLEIPAGTLEEREAPPDCARRNCSRKQDLEPLGYADYLVAILP